MAAAYFSWGEEDFIPIELIEKLDEHFPIVVKVKAGRGSGVNTCFQEEQVSALKRANLKIEHNIVK